jgi:hypothetical protein
MAKRMALPNSTKPAVPVEGFKQIWIKTHFPDEQR